MATSIPNMNPTGLVGAGYGNTGAPTGLTPLGTGGPGNMGFGNATNPVAPQSSSTNPFMANAMTTQPYGQVGTPTTTQNPGVTGTSTSPGNVTNPTNPYGTNNPGQGQWTQKYLEETYGGGMGQLIYQYLMSGGGYNSAITQQSVDAQVNAMGQQTQLGANNLASMLGASGVSAGSSGYGQTLGAYENQALTQQNAITAQEYYNMWNQAQQNELNMMEFAATGTAKTLANKPNWMDYLGLGIGGAQAGGSIMQGIGMMGMASGAGAGAGGGAIDLMDLAAMA